MLPLERVACPVMIEPGHWSVPADQRNVPSVMLGMTVHAGSAGPVRSHKRRMEPALLFQPQADLLVAFEALVLGRPSCQIMAIGALDGAAQAAVRPRQGTGRYLSRSKAGRRKQTNRQDANKFHLCLPTQGKKHPHGDARLQGPLLPVDRSNRVHDWHLHPRAHSHGAMHTVRSRHQDLLSWSLAIICRARLPLSDSGLEVRSRLQYSVAWSVWPRFP